MTRKPTRNNNRPGHVPSRFFYPKACVSLRLAEGFFHGLTELGNDEQYKDDMRIEVELVNGQNHKWDVTSHDVQRNIDAVNRAANKASMADAILLMDTISILRCIQAQLQDEHERENREHN